MNKEKTIVVFRRWRAPHSGVIALFPALAENGGCCQSYEHIGQHGAADYTSVIARSDPCYFFPSAPWATEVTKLYDELTGLGYHLVVRQRYIRKRG